LGTRDEKKLYKGTARVEGCAGVFVFWEGKRERAESAKKKRRGFFAALGMTSRTALMGEGEDEEVAFARDDDGEGAAVVGDRKFAESEAVQNGNGRGL